MLLLFVLFAALMPVIWFWSNRAGGLQWFSNVDKVLHGGTFFLLAVWFAGLYPRSRYLAVGLGLFLFGALIEGCQLLLSYRTAETWDLLANTAGIGAGLLLSVLGLGRWCQWLETRLASPGSG